MNMISAASEERQPARRLRATRKIRPGKAWGWLVAMLFCTAFSASANAHEGTSEERAMRMLGLLGTMDKTWAAQQRETDAAKRAGLIETHAQALLAMQEVLRDAADQSPCVMMEASDRARQTACLVDTEARLRATERVLWHVLNRVSVSGK